MIKKILTNSWAVVSTIGLLLAMFATWTGYVAKSAKDGVKDKYEKSALKRALHLKKRVKERENEEIQFREKEDERQEQR